jgi:VanZ family protein
MKKFYLAFSIYLIFLIILLLWPFQIRLNNVQWLEDSNGIAFYEEGQVISLSPAVSLLEALQKGDGLSLETWISVNDMDQGGPARIVSYSLNTEFQNFTLGQSENNLVIRLRTYDKGMEPLTPQIELNNAFKSSDPVHVVITYDFSMLNIYLNGQLELEKQISSDRFFDWDPSHYFILGNEATGDRPWKGVIYYLAIYNRTLNIETIDRHYELGWEPCDTFSTRSCRNPDGLVVNYLFEMEHGDFIPESHGADNSLRLYMPLKILNVEQAYLSTSFDVTGFRPVLVIVMNILVFIPLGMFFHFIFSIRYGNSFKIALVTFAIGSFLSFFVENVQFFMLVRNSSFIDLLCNMMGTAIGIFIAGRPEGRCVIKDLFHVNKKIHTK